MILAFPEIVTTLPVGTQMVSTIDDFERETRTWLKQCMQQISGYPDVETIGVKSWTTATRPSSNPNENLLLGYNTTTGSLELIGQNGAITEVLSDAVKKQIALVAHPVGEYYWTSDTSFNPNNAWGGTWERIQDGRCLVSNCSAKTYTTAKQVGATGGSETVTLNVNQIPSHSHPHTHKHRHDKGTMNITGTYDFAYDYNAIEYRNNFCDGAFVEGDNWTDNRRNLSWETSSTNQWQKMKFDAKSSWTGYTNYDETSASAHAQGGGQAHNNMPPYRVAVCWHRTA